MNNMNPTKQMNRVAVLNAQANHDSMLCDIVVDPVFETDIEENNGVPNFNFVSVN